MMSHFDMQYFHCFISSDPLFVSRSQMVSGARCGAGDQGAPRSGAPPPDHVSVIRGLKLHTSFPLNPDKYWL